MNGTLAERIVDLQDDGGTISKLKMYDDDPKELKAAIKMLWDIEDRMLEQMRTGEEQARIFERKQCCATICMLCREDLPVQVENNMIYHIKDGKPFHHCTAFKIRKFVEGETLNPA